MLRRLERARCHSNPATHNLAAGVDIAEQNFESGGYDAAIMEDTLTTHKSPFSDLVVPSSGESLSPEFCDRWVSPFYMNFLGLHFLKPGFEAALGCVYATIDQKIIEALLSEFDWRPRIVAGHFAALKNISGVVHLVGRLLLRSDVCFAATPVRRSGSCGWSRRCGN